MLNALRDSAASGQARMTLRRFENISSLEVMKQSVGEIEYMLEPIYDQAS
jgi:hypothetical protein